MKFSTFVKISLKCPWIFIVEFFLKMIRAYADEIFQKSETETSTSAPRSVEKESDPFADTMGHERHAIWGFTQPL